MNNSAHFEKQLTFGRLGEATISKLLISHGHSLLNACDIKCNPGKGPRISGQIFDGNEVIAPDWLVIHQRDGARWVEGKTKSVFTWYRKRDKWQTGIDYHHFKQYLEVIQKTGLPLWLLFLHIRSTPDSRDLIYCPSTCPTGLFAVQLREGHASHDHIDPRWGKTGMIYWNHGDLNHVATLSECCKAAGLPPPDQLAAVASPRAVAAFNIKCELCPARSGDLPTPSYERPWSYMASLLKEQGWGTIGYRAYCPGCYPKAITPPSPPPLSAPDSRSPLVS